MLENDKSNTLTSYGRKKMYQSRFAKTNGTEFKLSEPEAEEST